MRYAAWGALLVSGCAAPIRQYDLMRQPLSCEQANQYAYRTMQSIGFTVTAFDLAESGRPGKLRGHREERGSRQDVTVLIECDTTGANIVASEDGRWLGQMDLKRGFYLAFTSIVSRDTAQGAAARTEAEHSSRRNQETGLHVLLVPVTGLAAKLDFGLDLAGAGVLPVRVTIQNATPRAYDFDPAEFVLIGSDGARVPPLPVSQAIRLVGDVESRKAPSGAGALEPAAVAARLEGRVFDRHSVSAGASADGYLFYPLAAYVRGRVVLEDRESRESEGFVVEF